MLHEGTLVHSTRPDLYVTPSVVASSTSQDLQAVGFFRVRLFSLAAAAAGGGGEGGATKQLHKRKRQNKQSTVGDKTNRMRKNKTIIRWQNEALH